MQRLLNQGLRLLNGVVNDRLRAGVIVALCKPRCHAAKSSFSTQHRSRRVQRHHELLNHTEIHARECSH